MPIRVLLADDHAVVRDGLRFILEAGGDVVVAGDASDGREAVLLAQRLTPDVVIMDIAMPELNGIEATRRIHEKSPSCRVIILSMHSSREHIYLAWQAGAQGYLLKESAGKEVVTAVHSVMNGRRYVSQRIAETAMDEFVELKQAGVQRAPLERLSTREREILQLVVEGKSSVEIGGMLNLSAKSVETYRSRLMQKLGISDIPALVKFAIRHGVTSLESPEREKDQ